MRPCTETKDSDSETTESDSVTDTLVNTVTASMELDMCDETLETTTTTTTTTIE